MSDRYGRLENEDRASNRQARPKSFASRRYRTESLTCPVTFAIILGKKNSSVCLCFIHGVNHLSSR